MLHVKLVIAFVVTDEEFNVRLDSSSDRGVVLEQITSVQSLDLLEKLLLKRTADIGLEHAYFS